MRVLWTTLAIILVDQITKLFIKGSAWFGIKGMHLGESKPIIGDWFKLTFTENPGMAFGMELAPKLLLTLFSLVATFLILWYLWRVRNAHWGYRLSLASILGGAFGNIIDRVFYAKLYGYGDWFYGQVVDFIHFDIWRGTIASWVPIWGGQWTALFPIWNVADMSIVVGVVSILLFQGRFHRFAEKQAADADAAALAAIGAPTEHAETVLTGETMGATLSENVAQNVIENAAQNIAEVEAEVIPQALQEVGLPPQENN
jgi:signal peptidase II